MNERLSDLARQYRKMSDNELVVAFLSRKLSNEASILIQTEMELRGLNPQKLAQEPDTSPALNESPNALQNEVDKEERARPEPLHAGEVRYLKGKQFAICFSLMLVLDIYSLTSATFRIPFFLPIGILVMTAMSVAFMKGSKRIYPKSSRAAGQFALTFLFMTFYAKGHIQMSLERNIPHENLLFETARYHAMSLVAASMTLIMIAAYLTLKMFHKTRQW